MKSGRSLKKLAVSGSARRADDAPCAEPNGASAASSVRLGLLWADRRAAALQTDAARLAIAFDLRPGPAGAAFIAKKKAT